MFDPTQNVLDLVQAAVLRQDDLRQAEKEHLRELLALRGEQGDNDRRHIKDMVALRAEYDADLREAEAKRIDAIRAVDVAAVAAAAAVQTTQASTLATQVATSAEALRNQVAAAASAQTVALAAALEPIIKDIADLRRAQYEAQGSRAQIVETRAGGGAVAGYIAGAVGVLALILGGIALLLSQSGTPAG